MSTRIHVGCCGFTANQQVYRGRLNLVEVQQTFYEPPKVGTAQRWRGDLGPDFVFTMKAWQLITHSAKSPTYRRLARPVEDEVAPRLGFFQDTPEVWKAWERTRAVADALEARIVLFQSPADFTPTERHRRNLREFFSRAAREGRHFAFEPQGLWQDDVVNEICADLDLVRAVDPLHDEEGPPAGGIGYFRLHGPATGRYRYDDLDLELILEKCASFSEVFCLFANVEKDRDARRFASMVQGI